ncbi:MAG: BON domain-containing protein [Blastocatellia bacterium]
MKDNFLVLIMVVIFAFSMMACNPSEPPNAANTTNTTKPTMSNSDLENNIKAKIDSDARLKAANISIDGDAEKKTATLSGTVESESLRTKAVDLAKSAQVGLVVTDKIDVKPRDISRSEYTDDMAKEARTKAKGYGETIGDSLDDAWIHTKIVAKLIGNTTTPQRKINVDVVKNAVTLRGTVDTAEEKTEAESVAKNTEGVKTVKNMLVVKKS